MRHLKVYNIQLCAHILVASGSVVLGVIKDKRVDVVPRSYLVPKFAALSDRVIL